MSIPYWRSLAKLQAWPFGKDADRFAVVAVLVLLLPLQNPVSAQPVPQPSPLKPFSAVTDEAENKAQPGTDERVYQSACPGLLEGLITGKTMPPIRDGICGVRSPLEVSAVSGVALSNPAILSCRMAETLSRWVGDVQETIAAEHGIRMTGMITSTHYHCRRRNNRADGKVSEHGFANALDITGIDLSDGRKLTVASDWGDTTEENSENLTRNQEITRLLHAKACRHFTTVLGPSSDPQHEDHLHFDLGCHGKNCTYKICQ